VSATGDGRLRAVVAAAQRVARARALVLERMGEALDRDDVDEVIRCARMLTGRGGNDAEGHRVGPGLDRIAGRR
jgi:hypothetical protein